MDMFVSSTAFAATPAAMPVSPDVSVALVAAAASLLDHLAHGRAVHTPALRAAMSDAFMRRGARVLGTQGIATCFGSGFPQRAGYGPATALSFFPVVEAYDDD
jgi:hypothetical protein